MKYYNTKKSMMVFVNNSMVLFRKMFCGGQVASTTFFILNEDIYGLKV